MVVTLVSYGRQKRREDFGGAGIYLLCQVTQTKYWFIRVMCPMSTLCYTHWIHAASRVYTLVLLSGYMEIVLSCTI